MKIKYVIKNRSKLVRLQLLKTKNYNKNYFFINLKIEDIQNRLIKGFKIIYKYNSSNKNILFLNNCLTIETKLKELLKKTTYFYISKYLRSGNVINNKESFLLTTLQKYVSYKISNLKNKNNLIIFLNKKVNKNDLKKSYKSKIPHIFVGNALSNFDSRLSYKILGNFFYKKNQHFLFFVLLNSVIKKRKQIKN